jgi:iron complex outermembrane receptor protein
MLISSLIRSGISVGVLAVAMTASPAAAQTAASSTAADPQTEQPAADPPASEPRPAVTGESADDTPQSGEVVVTAQKRSERLIDVPLAVTAVSGATLANQQINDSQSLSRAVPSLSYQQGGAPNNSSFRVRGVGTSLFGQGVEPSVSVVVDGVVAPRASSGFADLLDIERVEVLRGPQGTLFGKNATAGVINVVTARPSSTFGGNVEATVAEREEYRVKGTITGPLGENLKGRLSGYYNNVGGYLYNIATDSHEGGVESWGVRGKLEWQPTDTLDILLSGEYRKSDANCCVTPFVDVRNPAFAQLIAPLVASPDNHRTNNDDLSYVNTKLRQASLQIDWDLGPATLTSITAWQGYSELNQAEQDQIVSVPTRFAGAGAAFAAWNFQPAAQKQDSYTQEIRLGSNGGGDLTYVAGIFLSKLDLSRNLVRRRQTCSAGPAIGAPCTGTIVNQSGGFDADFESKNASAFGQADLRVAGGLHVLGGLRVQYEKQRVVGSVFGPLQTGDALFPGTIVNSGTSERSDTAVTGKAGLRYEFARNFQTYGSYTRGYKAFALDLGATTRFDNNPGLSPEHVDAYEVGAKFRTTDGKFDVNAALFRSDYTNLQTQTVVSDPVTGAFTVQQINAGKSRSEGLELEANFRPSQAFSIAASFSYVKATIDIDGLQCALQQQATAPILTSNFPINSCYRQQRTTGGVVTTSPPIIDVRGGALPVAPRYRATITPRYDAEVGSGLRAFVQANLAFQSRSLFAVNQDPLLEQEAYTLVDLSAGIGDVDRRYTLSVFVRNLFDRNYYTGLAHVGLLATTAQPFDLQANYAKDSRRYAGATFSVRF